MKFWKVWAKALGEKAVPSDSSISDKVAVIRTVLVLVNFITCIFIISNTVRHW